jgi:serine/threonine protein kinase
MENLQITNYSIKNSIGQGGMATVYLAEDIKFQTNVAIKVLNKEYVHNDNIRKRFIAEARNMFKMSHPNIIKVSDLIDEGDTVAFVMEYIEGETLKEYLERKGKLSDDEIKNFFTQMLDALGYVHKQNLVHRDIKPSNFMVDVEGKIKLLDFGIAKTTDVTSSEYTQTGTGIQMGTPLYMSPEQITETKSVNAQSDIYSLGVVLWQMVTGQKPYDTKTLSSFQLQLKIVNDNLELTNTIWDSCIQKATLKDALVRFDNTSEFKIALNNLSIKNIPFDEGEKTILSDTNKSNSDEPKKDIENESEEDSIVEKINEVSEKQNDTINPEIKSDKTKIKSNNRFIIIGVMIILIIGFFIVINNNYLNQTKDNNSFVDSTSVVDTVNTIPVLKDTITLLNYNSNQKIKEKNETKDGKPKEKNIDNETHTNVCTCATPEIHSNKIQNLLDKYNKRYKSMVDVYLKKIKKYEEESLKTSDNINELRVAEVKDMERKILEFKQASEQELKQIDESYKNKKN